MIWVGSNAKSAKPRMVVTHYPIDQEERKEVGPERIEWSEPPAYGRI